ncbi:MAG: hypothetical protein KJ077_10645 [Anaerolineae bacterium]|nr:hypothetical protein [Anaerolineae bacterium]
MSNQPIEGQITPLPQSLKERFLNFLRFLLRRPQRRRYGVVFKFAQPVVVPPGETRRVLLKLPPVAHPSFTQQPADSTPANEQSDPND